MRTRSHLLPILNGVARLLPRRLGTDGALVAQARALAGPDEGDLATALAKLLHACAAEADLSEFGCLALHWDISRLLTNLARLRDEESRAPDIRAEAIAAPLVVTGLPRSGTTFLHSLLAEDPASQALRCWQAVYPYPDAGAAEDGSRRARRVAWQLRSFAMLAPDFRSVHPLDGRSPQECTELTAHVFQSLRFDTTHHVPSYRQWLDTHGHLPAYRFHRRFLQHLQHQGDARRWVLKSPDHVFALDALHAAYPDARVVFVHRDPLKILPSVASLTEVLRAPFTRATDRRQIGRQVLRDWRLGAVRMMAASRHWGFGSPTPFHVHYADIVARPVETIGRLYRHFDMRLDDAAAARMSRLAASRPRGGYGRNVYRAAEYGFDPEALRHIFADYVAHFGIAEETPARPSAETSEGGRFWTARLPPRAAARP